ATGFETFSVLDDTEGTFFSVSQDLDVEEAGAQKRTSLLCSLLCSLVRETPDMVCAVCAHDDEAVVAEPPPPAAKKRQPVRDKALSLLAKHDRTEQQMRESLARSGYGEEEVQGTIDFLKEYGYIDDEAYAGKYLRELIRKGRGRWRIRGDMLRHGLESEVVEETLRNGYPREEELALARAAAGKAARSLPEGTPPHERARRVSQKLSAQGFDYDVISNAIDTLSLIE
ncbi:MAG: RecX family transcriptional regulator, partial [Clostridiales Family XIII bacterium]|nr:RecX family transcriptional regulator [Clostridiales Family XIII bacterium]